MYKTPAEKNTRIILRTILGISLMTVIGFVGTKLYPIIHGPSINVSTLINGGVVHEPMVKVSGIAAFTKELVINGKALPLSPDGIFDEKIVLNPGYNVITVSGSDRYGTSNIQTYSMVLDEPVPSLTMNVAKPLP